MSRHAQLVSSSNWQNTQYSYTQHSVVNSPTVPLLQGLQWFYAQLALVLQELHNKETVKEGR